MTGRAVCCVTKSVCYPHLEARNFFIVFIIRQDLGYPDVPGGAGGVRGGDIRGQHPDPALYGQHHCPAHCGQGHHCGRVEHHKQLFRSEHNSTRRKSSFHICKYNVHILLEPAFHSARIYIFFGGKIMIKREEKKGENGIKERNERKGEKLRPNLILKGRKR